MLITSIPQFIQGLTNAKLDLISTNATVLYTAPSTSDFNVSIVNSILVSNYTTGADTITVTITDATSDATVFSLFKLKAVAANTTVELLTRDLILKSGEILTATAATADTIEVVASIQEFIKQRISTSAVL